MNDDKAVPKQQTRIQKLIRSLMFVSASLVALYCVGRLVWRFSGSNQWELVREGNGAQVYALKEPGTDLQQFRGRVRVHSTLARAVAWLQDTDTCKDAGCLEAKTIAQVDEQLQYVTMQFNMPGPFRRRDFVMRVRFHQIPSTKEIWVEYAAAPDKTPPNDCCFRVTNMSNTWRLTPLAAGQIEIEYTMNMDWGGFLPDLLSNRIRPRYLFRQLQKLEAYVNRDKYRTAKFIFIQEDAKKEANVLKATADAAMASN